MRLSHLSLVDFRSYAGLELALEAGVGVLVGPNGQGKTNVIEAIGYLANQGSHRVAQDAPLVRAGAERAVVRGAVRHEDRTAMIELEINPGRSNRARLNRAPVNRPRDVLGYLRTVLFAPEDLALVKGDPAERRRFLDELLVARAPRYAGVRADYERALKQRNALLKSASMMRRAARGGQVPDLSTLDVWDAHLAKAGAHLLAARLELLRALSPLADKAYGTIAGHPGAMLEYRPSCPLDPHVRDGGDTVGVAPAPDPMGRGRRREVDELEAALAVALSRSRAEEVERGVTLVGPHRDDVLFAIDHGGGALPAKTYASHGESWSFALAVKLASYDLLRSDGIEPVLLLDDVFAELDTARRTHLAAVAASAEQVLITAAVDADVPPELDGVRYRVAKGSVTRGDTVT
ncbi:DNA replication/repair protein RecF [Actinocrinis puniceicyclus]|uniref:DNA replication and repair protein RecF n=1 Tax=Actinocrinis puniceicyclus TaxID=977794 RepID=A0A8J7WH63_9ACTN|nr:DNA replication/repair protein RecF [Actinocrinis puniceicyclus]MBS2962113.1 DNA replication/repair protein RecF [Actinocrinis puniceicyclus]